MTAFYEPADVDTWTYAATPHARSAASSSLRCGCAGDISCDRCNGDAEDAYQDLRDARAAVRDRWRAGELTARQYYLLSAGVDRDGLPSRDAVAAVQREQERAARGAAA